jgi:hypothetical protein
MRRELIRDVKVRREEDNDGELELPDNISNISIELFVVGMK